MVKFFKKYHKWISIVSIFFILVFAVSGVLLNHRKGISKLDVSRSWLPQKYHIKEWNNGAVKGTVKLAEDSILMYGASGLWLTNSVGDNVTPFSKGLPYGVDNQNFRALIKQGGKLLGVSTYRLYEFDIQKNVWEDISDRIDEESAFTDLCSKGDTVFVVSRSHIYKTVPPYRDFEKVHLREAADFDAKVSLFRTLWILHSGEIFGLPGKLVVDILGIIIIILTITGIVLTVLRIGIRRGLKREGAEKLKKGWKFSLKWHNKLGYFLFVLLLFVVVTGTFLRPPLLIPIARARVSPIPFSTLDSKNPWHDKIRVLRFDKFYQRWFLYSSDGFYQFSDFSEKPVAIKKRPPISVMGVTVLEQKNEEEWLVGSFSGLYMWNSKTGEAKDAFTGEVYKPQKTFGPPVFSNPINGYSGDFATGDVAFDYGKGAICLNKGIDFYKMPKELASSPMSLWNVALEFHVGRMYGAFLGPLSVLFVFFSGILFLFILVSGYIVYKRRHKKIKKKKRKI